MLLWPSCCDSAHLLLLSMLCSHPSFVNLRCTFLTTPSISTAVPANVIKFNKAKYEVLHLDWGSPRHKYSLHGGWIETSLGEKDLGVFVDKKLSMNQHCVLAAQKPNRLCCIRRGVTSRSWEGILCPCSGEAPLVLMHPGLGPPKSRKTWTCWN